MFLLGIFLIFLIHSFKQGLISSSGEYKNEGKKDLTTSKIILAGLAIIIGIGGVLWGANQLVNGSIVIARSLGVSEEIIGLTMVALGTSLPELSTSLVAAIRGNVKMAVGNVLGSNLFNLLLIGGIAAAISPITVPTQLLQFDMWVMLGATFILVPFLTRNGQLGRVQGAYFFIAYLCYIGLQATSVGRIIN